ncbi:type II 3-dehydroquinate dehydratase [Gramella sp. MAR_2010_147]|uniref:type II 3-dehydroquinate dehydratase n=1 Tax=Gramella sp. MAR_2010_147 TaxID=1250205 RepID=UPI00087DBEEA|nr:type II 3-dehydroquinate dehydratase [Gramella sp. MAR_2010_147]SDR72993.1 3-dehydroquinate dehydratase [Gramella sp. MAR_2010_147]
MKLLILNGPNLNLLGTREPEKYGNKSFENYFSELQFKFRNIELSYDQTNIEGELINMIHNAREDFDGIILNAAAYTHTSVGIGDAVAAVETPVVEVHISNTFSREEFRHKSYISAVAKGIIVGFGLQSYDLAIQSFLNDKNE